MRSILMVVGGLASTYIGVQTFDLPKNAQQVSAIQDTAKFDLHTAGLIEVDRDSKKPIIWKLSVRQNDGQCSTSFISDTNYQIAFQGDKTCNTFAPQLDQLQALTINEYGNITLTGNDGKKLVEFMESESTNQESVWPQYPLMTLTRVD